jgi:hypothetical protein
MICNFTIHGKRGMKFACKHQFSSPNSNFFMIFTKYNNPLKWIEILFQKFTSKALHSNRKCQRVFRVRTLTIDLHKQIKRTVWEKKTTNWGIIQIFGFLWSKKLWTHMLILKKKFSKSKRNQKLACRNSFVEINLYIRRALLKEMAGTRLW